MLPPRSLAGSGEGGEGSMGGGGGRSLRSDYTCRFVSGGGGRFSTSVGGAALGGAGRLGSGGGGFGFVIYSITIILGFSTGGSMDWLLT